MQEALTNVLKHAQAQHVSIVITRRNSELRAVIEDDGKGFATDALQTTADMPRRLGLLGMRERAALVGGTLTLESAPGHGTTVLFWLPLAEK